ncbi:MAG: M23 family metallopeptidase [Elusimicrobia bacterium]|nr:M23 family metallopeptidase [Elusimicrobiota bacterium]
MRTIFIFFSFVLIFSCAKKTSEKKEYKYEGITKPGDTIYSIFKKYKIAWKEGAVANKELKKIFKTSDIRTGYFYEITISTDLHLLNFSISPSPEIKYSIIKTTSGFVAKKIKLKLIKKIFGKSGTINDNLYNSMVKAGIDPYFIMNYAEIFESRIDFLTEPRKGDRFFIVYEKIFTEKGQEVTKGKILAGKYVFSRRKKEYIAFAFPINRTTYYFDPKGSSLSTQFLKAPLHYRRISSYFSYRRFHPILRYVRPHFGIDYAAPRGTPISSIGDGKVIFVGRNGGFGKQVKIKHNSIYESWYGHLSRYAKGIRRGVYVKKGQVIGYVGATGLATGPHLDFRIKKRGKFVNFLKLKLPPAKKLNKKQMEEFKKFKKNYYRYFALLQMYGKFEENASD